MGSGKENLLRLEQSRVGTWGQWNPVRWRSIQEHAVGRILDIGCSSGSYVASLSAEGREAFGCDVLRSPEWSSHPGRFLIADIVRLPFADESFETLLLFEVIEHIADPLVALAEARRVLSERLILSVPNCTLNKEMELAGLAYHHWIDRTHKQFFTTESLRDTLEKAKLLVEDMSLFNEVLPETLAFTTFGFSPHFAHRMASALSLLPRRKRYCMSIMAVAGKRS